MLKLSCGWKSWSRKVVHDSCPGAEAVGGGGEMVEKRGWENMAAELLREIFKRVEEDEKRWPFRKTVVACAGVCTTWREAMKDVVLTPHISGRLTFPISLKQPGPRNSLLQCYIKRNSSTRTFHLYLNLSLALADDGKFLLAARRFRRPTCTDYIISLHSNDIFKGNNCYVGKLRSNFLGTKFDVYDAKPPHTEAKTVKSRSLRLPESNQISPRVPCGNYPVAHVSYELNMLTTRGPRKMNCVLDSIPASALQPGGVAPTQMDFPITDIDSFQSSSSFRATSTHLNKTSRTADTTHVEKPLILRNKVPRWHQQLQCWCLNFHGRVTVASVKNFQLVASPGDGESGADNEKIILQFGKVGKDVFTMDYCYPLSAFQAFAICLSSFDTKIACE